MCHTTGRQCAECKQYSLDIPYPVCVCDAFRHNRRLCVDEAQLSKHERETHCVTLPVFRDHDGKWRVDLSRLAEFKDPMCVCLHCGFIPSSTLSAVLVPEIDTLRV